MQSVLIVDRETDFLEWCNHQLQTPTRRVLTTDSAEKAFQIFCLEKPDVVIAEMNLHPFSGLELLARIRKESPSALVIMVSAFGTTQAVIESMKLGAFDFVRKESLPFNLKVVVESALKAHEELASAQAFHPRLTVEQYQDDIVGQSEPMQQVFKMIGRAAPSDAPVMITGESGSGKELVARAIHHYSNRSRSGFLAINCAAIPENLLESELFGHEKGSFTGAMAQRIGRFEQADGGTLFLDEIGDMPLPVQSKLLRVLQEGEYSRVGGNKTLKTDVRIVAATNQKLESEISKKRFREDLFYRLNVVRIHLPPLRERVQDIRLLAEYFLRKIAAQRHKPLLKLSEQGIRHLEGYSWPGNVRELENTLQRAVVLATSAVLLPKNIPLGMTNEIVAEHSSANSSVAPTDIDGAMEILFSAGLENTELGLLPWVERELTLRAMKKTSNNQVKASKLLGITRPTLRKRLEQLGILSENSRSTRNE
ncbi:MAG: sigma-54 dependent transcriptional regulator [Chthoniobacterales bacterium]